MTASPSQIGVAAGDDLRRRLWLSRLTLTNFRSYAQASVSLGPSCVVLTGCNGAGKTNILEAVSLLAPGRGLRGAQFAELARQGAEAGWSVAGRIALDGADIALGTGQMAGAAASPAAGAGRLVKIDGAAAGSSGALGDYMQVIWLTPGMDGLFTGSAGERRRFLDRMVASLDGAHRTRLSHFERAMRQRNRLFETGERSGKLFAAIESQMAETGTAISAARVEAVDRLAGVIGANRSGANTAFPWADLALEGWLEASVREGAAVLVEDAYAGRLAEGRERDRAAGRTLEGPHRADLLVRHGPKDMPGNLCSTGEQKALLIGLVLAHAAAVTAARGGVPPVLLLDEVAAHLDSVRREALFTETERLGAQAWLTGTERDVFEPLQGRAQFLSVADGAISHEDQKREPRPARRMRTA